MVMYRIQVEDGRVFGWYRHDQEYSKKDGVKNIVQFFTTSSRD